MERIINERADRVVNLLRVDELYAALEEFRNEDLRAGEALAFEKLCGSISEGSAISQADGSGDAGYAYALPELHGRPSEGPERQREYEKEMEESLRLGLKYCACTMEYDPKEKIYHLSICPYHKDTPNLFDSLLDV